MKRRAASSYVGFSLTERERARLSRLASQLGFSQLDSLAADLLRIGLTTLEHRFQPLSRHERFVRARRAVKGRTDAQNH